MTTRSGSLVTEPSYLAAVRESYDTVADAYTAAVKEPAELDPVSRAMLTSFAELVRADDQACTGVRDHSPGVAADQSHGPGSVADPGYASGENADLGREPGGIADLGCAPGRVADLGCAPGRVADLGCAPGGVADLGCGPGKVTAFLASLGVRVFGVDVSPRMVALAQDAYPGLRFTVGSMTALDVRDGELGGVLAYYSTHHTPPALLPTLYAEFHRVLVSGGRLMLTGHVGQDALLRPTHAYGDHPVSYETHLLPPEHIADLLEQAGFTLTARLVQEPGEGRRRAIGTFLAVKA